MVTLDKIQHENKMQKLKQEVMEKILVFGGQWMIILYNTGKCP